MCYNFIFRQIDINEQCEIDTYRLIEEKTVVLLRKESRFVKKNKDKEPIKHGF